MQRVEYQNNVKFEEFFKADSEKKVVQKMDRRLDQLNRQHGQPISVTRVKIGRNDPCPCSSGKKFKKCCISKTR